MNGFPPTARSRGTGRYPGVIFSALLLFAAVEARAEVRFSSIQTRAGSGINIEMVGFFNELPKSGCAPIKITIRNDSGRARTWTFSFNSQSHQRVRFNLNYTWSARVEAGQQRAYEVSVPMVTVAGRSYSYLNATVRGYGVERNHASYAAHSRYSGHSHTPFVLMSSKLGTAVWSRMQEELESRGRELTGCLFDPSPAWVPSDWRAYTGVVTLWLADTDWDGLSAEVRTALLQWVAQGGVMFYCASGNVAARMDQAGFAGSGLQRAHGLGLCIGFARDEPDLSVSAVADAIVQHGVEPSAFLLDGYQQGWALKQAMGSATINAPLLIFSVIVFAVVIGPLNLIVFAGPRRRHRLFFTTPLLSLVTALALGCLILVSDGVGGQGRRAALALLLPERREVVHVQEQIALTGVLLSQHFPVAEGAVLEDIRLAPGGQGRSSELRLRPDSADGTWFRSRSLQAHYLASVRPSRARVEVILPGSGEDAPATPVLRSTVEDALRDVFYIDHDGGYWHAPELNVGRPTPTVASSWEEYNRVWLRQHLRASGLLARGRIERMTGRGNHVYAVAKHPPPERFMSTHPSIDWESMLFYMGPCLVAGGATP